MVILMLIETLPQKSLVCAYSNFSVISAVKMLKITIRKIIYWKYLALNSKYEQ